MQWVLHCLVYSGISGGTPVPGDQEMCSRARGTLTLHSYVLTVTPGHSHTKYMAYPH